MDDIYEPDGTDVYGSLLGDAYGGKSKVKFNPPSDVEINLKCTLEEFYNGSLKKTTYKRDKIQGNGRSVCKIDEDIVVDVKPGYTAGTKLRYKLRGNEQFSFPRSSLIVTLQLDESKETPFTRKGDDLIYTHRVSLEDALRSVPVRIQTLDNRIISLNLDQMITPQTVHEIVGEGMPIMVQSKEYLEGGIVDPEEIKSHLLPLRTYPKGNLFVRFDILFPETINIEQKLKIVELLRKNKEETE